MFPGGAELEIEILDFCGGFALISGKGIVVLLGVKVFLVPVGCTKATSVGCLSGFSVLSDTCFWKSDLPHTISKEKVVVAYNQVTQNRQSLSSELIYLASILFVRWIRLQSNLK